MAKQKSMQYKLKKDRYVNTRGGNSHFLNIYCSNCGQHIALYQKDGQGSLLRLYLDRIFNPKELSELHRSSAKKNDVPNLDCPGCGSLIGAPMMYKPEKRFAFRLIRGSFVQKKLS